MTLIDLRKTLYVFGYGFLSWIIPFLIAIPFYLPDGTILIDPALFKSIMVVTGSGIGAALIASFFRVLKDRYLFYGIFSGFIWLIINWVLDLVILVPMSGLDISSYMNQIGLRYLIIPIMTIMAGIIAQFSTENSSEP